MVTAVLNGLQKFMGWSRGHDDVIKWKLFPRYWPFVRGIHRSPVNSPHKGQWRGALMFSLISTRLNGWVNNGEAGDLRWYRAHYDVTVMDGLGVNLQMYNCFLVVKLSLLSLTVCESFRYLWPYKADKIWIKLFGFISFKYFVVKSIVNKVYSNICDMSGHTRKYFRENTHSRWNILELRTNDL